jgi:hypothetical protein
MEGLSDLLESHPVQAIPPTLNTGALVGDYICLKTMHGVWIVVNIQQGHATPPAITIEQATNVAMGSSTAITVGVPIWSNLDTATNDTLTKRTNAVGYTPDAALKNKVVLFKVDSSTLNIAGGFDCLGVKVGASDTANLVGAMYYPIAQRYKGDLPPSAITD